MADRSPNYPAYDLGEAVGFVRRVYKAEGKSSAVPAVIANAVGYSSLSGSARRKIASMRQYGLIEDAPGGKIRVSRAGVSISHNPDAAESKKLLREAALQPSLFRELHEKHPDASDRNLEVVLINEKSFLPDGARRVVKAYRATLAFANLGAGGYNGSEAEANGESEDEPEGGADEPTDQDSRHRGSGKVTYSWPMDDAEKVEVAFIGSPSKKPTRRDLDALIDYLELIRKRTPEVAEDRTGGN